VVVPHWDPTIPLQKKHSRHLSRGEPRAARETQPARGPTERPAKSIRGASVTEMAGFSYFMLAEWAKCYSGKPMANTARKKPALRRLPAVSPRHEGPWCHVNYRDGSAWGDWLPAGAVTAPARLLPPTTDQGRNAASTPASVRVTRPDVDHLVTTTTASMRLMGSATVSSIAKTRTMPAVICAASTGRTYDRPDQLAKRSSNLLPAGGVHIGLVLFWAGR
jgi:hypothetical protein